MSSFPKCILPASHLVPPIPAPHRPPATPWNELAAFRETALRHFTRPDDLACLCRLGELLYESALEQAHLWPQSGGCETASGVAAACRDFDHLLGFLTSLGDARHLSALPQPEHVLAAIAARTVRRIRPEVHVLGAGLAQYQAAVAYSLS